MTRKCGKNSRKKGGAQSERNKRAGKGLTNVVQKKERVDERRSSKCPL